MTVIDSILTNLKLAKQAWCLIHNTHSLFFQVYKSRYFPNCSFMDVEIGSNLSYVCRILLTARDLIKEGSKLQVGDGRYIKVSTHKWLTHNPIFWGEVQPNLLVKDLIHDDTGQCDRDKVFDLFAHKTCMEIMLPICFGNSFCTKCLGPLIAKESFKNVQMLLKISSCYLGG